MENITIERPNGSWTLGFAFAKLISRGRLPGAFGYDQIAAQFRDIQRRGVPNAMLLAAAMPGSWMVNNRAPSTAFQKWLTPPLETNWTRLLTLLRSQPWSKQREGSRQLVASTVAELEVDGQGIAAISKVLALLCPDVVPLMDDAALAFALGVVEVPKDALSPTAKSEHFLPMLDWFARSINSNRAALNALAARYDLARLSAPQVLDRLLWFESWGWRLFRTDDARWWWVRGDAREGILPVHSTWSGGVIGEPLDIDAVDDPEWRSLASQSLSLMHDSTNEDAPSKGEGVPE